MKYALVKSRVETLLQQRNSAWVFSLVLLVVCAMQSMGLIYVGVLAHRGRVIERPIGLNSPFWVSSHGVSASFLAGMSRYLMQLYLDAAPATVDEQRTELLSHVSPSAYDSVKRTLIEMSGQIKKEDLSSVFLMDAPDVNTTTLQAKIRGTLILKAGDTNTIKMQKTFLLTFANQQGRLELTGLMEKKE